MGGAAGTAVGVLTASGVFDGSRAATVGATSAVAPDSWVGVGPGVDVLGARTW